MAYASRFPLLLQLHEGDFSLRYAAFEMTAGGCASSRSPLLRLHDGDFSLRFLNDIEGMETHLPSLFLRVRAEDFPFRFAPLRVSAGHRQTKL
jgi:hypothetical protein